MWHVAEESSMDVRRGHCMKLWRWSVGWVGDPKMLEMLESWDKEVYREGMVRAQEKKRVAANKFRSRRSEKPSNKPFTPYIELQDLESGLLSFILVLVLYFLTAPPRLLSFRMVIYILHFCLLEECNLLFLLYRGLQLRYCFKSQRGLWILI